MALTFSTAFRDQVLNGTVPSTVYLSAHTADPGTTGASEMSGGSYARASVALGTSTANGGRATAQGLIQPNGTATYIGMWSASTAGTFLCGGSITSQTAPFQGSITVTD